MSKNKNANKWLPKNTNKNKNVPQNRTKSDIGELSFSSCMPEGQCVCEQCQARFLITDRNIQYLHRALGKEVHLQLLLEGRIRLSSI